MYVGLDYNYICGNRLQLFMWDSITIISVGLGYKYICRIRLQLYMPDWVTIIYMSH